MHFFIHLYTFSPLPFYALPLCLSFFTFVSVPLSFTPLFLLLSVYLLLSLSSLCLFILYLFYLSLTLSLTNLSSSCFSSFTLTLSPPPTFSSFKPSPYTLSLFYRPFFNFAFFLLAIFLSPLKPLSNFANMLCHQDYQSSPNVFKWNKLYHDSLFPRLFIFVRHVGQSQKIPAFHCLASILVCRVRYSSIHLDANNNYLFQFCSCLLNVWFRTLFISSFVFLFFLRSLLHCFCCLSFYLLFLSALTFFYLYFFFTYILLFLYIV